MYLNITNKSNKQKMDWQWNQNKTKQKKHVKNIDCEANKNKKYGSRRMSRTKNDKNSYEYSPFVRLKWFYRKSNSIFIYEFTYYMHLFCIYGEKKANLIHRNCTVLWEVNNIMFMNTDKSQPIYVVAFLFNFFFWSLLIFMCCAKLQARFVCRHTHTHSDRFHRFICPTTSVYRYCEAYLVCPLP